MISHKTYNLNVNEDLIMFVTSKLIMCLLVSFTLGMKFQSIAYLLNGSIYTYILDFGP